MTSGDASIDIMIGLCDARGVDFAPLASPSTFGDLLLLEGAGTLLGSSIAADRALRNATLSAGWKALGWPTR